MEKKSQEKKLNQSMEAIERVSITNNEKIKIENLLQLFVLNF